MDTSPANPNFNVPLVQLPVPPTSQAVAAPEGKPPVAKSSKLWALEGLRSLAINLADQTSGEHIALTSLGVEPRATVTITHQSRLNWLAIALGVFVFGCGALIKSRRRLVGYMFAVVLIASLAPPLTGWEQELAPLATSVFAAVISLIPWSIFCGLMASLAKYWAMRPQMQVKANGINTAVAVLDNASMVTTPGGTTAAAPSPGESRQTSS